MYSNDQVQIRQGLVSYIGAVINASPKEGRVARQEASAILVEEALKIAQEEESLDMFVIKPVLRATVLILNQRIAELSKFSDRPHVRDTITDYQGIIEKLNKTIDSFK